jgi:hypothetical protein
MNRATFVLARHSLARIRSAVVVVSLLLAAFQFLLTQVAVYLLRRTAFAQLSALMPDFMRSAAGPSALAFMSFKGIISFGYFHPIVLTTLVGLMIGIATEPAAEVETRFVDLALARPLARRDVITRTLIVLFVAMAAVLVMMVASTSLGLMCCTPADAPRPTPALIGSLALSDASIMVCWAGVALACAAGARRRSVAGGVAGVIAVAAYLLDYVGRAWEPARAASALSPFHYFEPTTLITGQPLRVSNLAVLAAIGGAGIAVAYSVFSRRDI